MTASPDRRGLSLLELLVALAVFAVAAALAYLGLARAVEARRLLAAEQERLAATGFAIALLESDLRSAVPRAVRSEGGGEDPAFVGGTAASEWTRIGASLGVRGALPERVRYRVEDGVLLRERLAVTDRAPGLVPERSRLLPGVTGLVFRFLDGDGRWRPEWPAESGSGLPRAVVIELELQGLGEIRRVVPVGARR